MGTLPAKRPSADAAISQCIAVKAQLLGQSKQQNAKIKFSLDTCRVEQTDSPSTANIVEPNNR
jgi:hypothetical protein